MEDAGAKREAGSYLEDNRNRHNRMRCANKRVEEST